MYTEIRLALPYRRGPCTILALEYCVGRQTEQATVLHVRGRCDENVAFAGCLVLNEGRHKAASKNYVQGFPYNLLRVLRPIAAELSSWRTPRFTSASAHAAKPARITPTANGTPTSTS